jgi:hypothetical protein
VRRELLAQDARLAAPPVDRHDAVADPQDLRGRRARLDALDDRRRLEDAADQEQRREDEEGEDEVDRRARADDHEALPHRLAVVRAGLHLLGQLLARVHPADLHEAAGGDPADAVLGLAAADLHERPAEEEHEALDAHADRLGRREVAGLVQDDQHREAREGQHPAHASAPIRSAAVVRASRSAS